MSREIKFRAWDKKYNEMLNDVEIVYHAERITGGEANAVNPKMDRFVLMQYTELKDKNGVEIYEGDIVQYINGFGDKVDAEGVDMKFEVEYEECCFVCDGVCLSSYMADIEVIGNIHENPELLKDV